MEETNSKQNKRQKVIRSLGFLLVFFLSGAIACGGSYLYGREEGDMICNAVMVLLGTGIVLFALVSSEINGLYYYDNQGKYGKFLMFYLIGLTVALLFPLLPVAGWPFLVIFVILSLFSNSISGLIAGSVCLMLSIMLENGGSYREFFLYFFSGLVGIMVFSRLNDSYKVGVPIFISLLCLTVGISANLIMFEKEQLSISQFVIVAINLMVNFILLLITLKIFSHSVIHKDRDQYMDLNDPECPLLVQLKELSKKEYYHAVHTAYLGDKIAKRLGLDEKVVKACGYYHRIGLLKGENTWENIESICKEYHIPEDTRKILKEYVDPEKNVVSTETIIILFTDTIVSILCDMFEKNPKAELDYEQIIDTVFKDKIDSGVLARSEISIVRFKEMRKIFSEEKLYYDFLR